MFFLWLILIVILITVFFYNVSIKLEFENFVISFPKTIEKNEDNKKRKSNGKIKLKIYIFNKFKIADLDLKKIKKGKIQLKQIKNIIKSLNQKRNTVQLQITDIKKVLNIDVQKFNLEITIGIKDAATTAILVGILYAILNNFIIDKSRKKNNQRYLINTNYQNEMIFIKLDSIFKLDMRNIINMLFKQVKRRVNKNGTSNRKIDVFSNE